MALVRLLVALLLLVVTVPGGTELVELAGHLVAHADLPHHDEPTDGCSEHACTAMSHQCACHGTMFGRPESYRVAALDRDSSVTFATNPAPILYGRGADPPPLRPPIA